MDSVFLRVKKQEIMSGQNRSKIPYFPILFVLLILGAVIWKMTQKKATAEQQAPPAGAASGKPTGVNGFLVKPQYLESGIELPGTLLPYEDVEIRPEMNGRLVSLNLKEGSLVQKGSLIAKIFDADILAQMKKVEAQLALANQTESRLKQLLSVNGASKQEYDNALGQVTNYKADLDILKVQLSKTEIRAPFSGKLGLKSVSIGAYISPATLITTLQQLNPLKLEFSVPEKYRQLFNINQTLQFQVDGHPQKLSDKIYAFDTKADPNNRSVKVRALFNNPGQSFSPGTFLTVTLPVIEKSALMVPSQCIIPESYGKKVIVAKNGKATYQKVVTGVRNSSMVQITEGIQAGDTVVTTGQLALKPDAPVNISKLVEK